MSQQESALNILLADAVEIQDVNERDAYLRKVCGDNALQYVALQKMVQDYSSVGSLLEMPVDVLRTAEFTSSDEVGQKIGPYKLLELIGEGGMGLVYMSEQSKPIHRRVALKLIKPGMDTKQVLARFEAERQALAMMEHPNIARVLDAGTTDQGRPYFVMELVRGIPITEFCDQAQLSTRERLVLFKDICAAVQHAHMRGIIHRDLKPTNVLVTMIGLS